MKKEYIVAHNQPIRYTVMKLHTGTELHVDPKPCKISEATRFTERMAGIMAKNTRVGSERCRVVYAPPRDELEY